MPEAPLTLAIDTSCDETSVAVTRGVTVLSNVISSQVRAHRKYGGVVPFLARTLHQERIERVAQLALVRAGVARSELKAVAVTYGPGLAPALEVGVATAKRLAAELSIPLYPVNHMHAHIASVYAQVGSVARPELSSPTLAVLVSGGHSELVAYEQFGSFTLLGQTLDDALGEAYDKVATMLGLGYPGGAVVARLAERGDSQAFPLPVPMQRSGDFNLSYSGLKTAVRYTLERLREAQPDGLTEQQVCGIAASFESVAQRSLEAKVEAALAVGAYRSMILAGGVAANTALRKRLRRVASEYGVSFLVPTNKKLCTDNGAMVGVAAYLSARAGQTPTSTDRLDRKPGAVVVERMF